MNFSMNALALTVLARSLGRVAVRRVALAAVLGAVFAFAAEISAFRFLKSAWLLPLPASAMCLFAFPAGEKRQVPVRVVQLLGCFAFLAGTQFLFRQAGLSPHASSLAGTSAGTVALSAFLTRRKRRLVTWDVVVSLSLNGKEARFRALVDTGNRLTEPVSSLPVMIVEKSVLSDLFPHGSDPAQVLSKMSRPLRRVAFGGVGGRGVLDCFRPDLIFVNYGDGDLYAPDLWVAVYPGRLTGPFRALAPPVLGCISAGHAKEAFSSPRQEKGVKLWP